MAASHGASWLLLLGAVTFMPLTANAESAGAADLALPETGPYLHLLGALSWGKGIRFNNPYRLATPLGESAESVSASAGYLNFAFAASSGSPDGLLHGGGVALSVATDGVPQEVMTPSYQLGLRFPPDFFLYGRAGLPIVVEPDPNLGYELAVGGVYFFTAGLGATAELIGSLFYGAATQDTAATAIPLLSAQIGIAALYEVLP